MSVKFDIAGFKFKIPFAHKDEFKSAVKKMGLEPVWISFEKAWQVNVLTSKDFNTILDYIEKEKIQVPPRRFASDIQEFLLNIDMENVWNDIKERVNTISMKKTPPPTTVKKAGKKPARPNAYWAKVRELQKGGMSEPAAKKRAAEELDSVVYDADRDEFVTRDEYTEE